MGNYEQLSDTSDYGALFSECRNFRYALWRIWDNTKPLVMFVGLNPSTANEQDNDPTIRSVGRISKANGYGGFYMMNCFPMISPYPDDLTETYGLSKGYELHKSANNYHLRRVAKMCDSVVFAWGSFSIIKQSGRDKELFDMFPNAKALCINKNGSPKHPLYCKSNTTFINYTNN